MPDVFVIVGASLAGGTAAATLREEGFSGRVILVDHIRSSVRALYWLQRLMELAPSRNRDELTRRPRAHVEAVGFRVEASDRLRAGVVERLVARKP